LTGLFPHDLDRLKLTEMAEVVSRWLHEHHELGGAAEHGRLRKICDIVTRTEGVIERAEAPDEWRHTVQAFKDVQEFWYIISVLDDRLLNPPFIDSLKRSLLDAPLPGNAAGPSTGRDAQFELFLAAAASRAGLEVEQVGPSGADWQFAAPAGRWSMEAKRIKSFGQAKKRIRKAAKQIKERQVSGVIALDISAAANPEYDPLDAFVTDDALRAGERQRTEAFLAGPLQPVKEWVGEAGVGFLLLYDFVIRPAAQSDDGRHQPWSLIGFWGKVDLLAADSAYRDRFEELWSIFAAALPNY
jgi:hypothetical protein